MHKAHDKLLQKYETNLAGSSEHTRKSLGAIIRGFLAYAEDKELDKPTVLKYLNRLKRKKYADGTVDLHYRVILRFFKVNNLEGLSRHDAPTIRETNITAPPLEPELVEEMIAIRDSLTPLEAAYLALSTIYGLRRAELCNMTPECFKLRNNLLFVESLKGSRQRYHYIPDEIKPYLQAYAFSERITEWRASKVFWDIGKRIGMNFKGTEAGWHAIRRTLDTLLVDRIHYYAVRDFMRWKGNSSDMPGRYYSARRYIGRDGERIEMAKGEREQDERIFEVHPFLPCWKGESNAKATQGSKAPKGKDRSARTVSP